MKKNILHSTLLSTLLMVPNLAFCAEQPSFSKDIRMWFSMPTAPEWMTNFTTNLTSGLSDTKKYLLYGGGVFLTALFGYIGYRVVSFMGIPTSIENRQFGDPDYKDLNAFINCRNIAIIIKNYDDKDDQQKKIREIAFKHYICPVLNRFQDRLNSKKEWQSFLFGVKNSYDQRIEGKWELAIRLDGSHTEYGVKIFKLINKTCPNRNITKPLRELLIEKNPNDTELLQTLNQ